MRQPHVGPKRNSDGPCALVDWTAEEEIDEGRRKFGDRAPFLASTH